MGNVCLRRTALRAMRLAFALCCVGFPAAPQAAPQFGALQSEYPFEKNIGQLGADVAFRSRLPRIEAQVRTDGSLAIVRRGESSASAVRVVSRGARTGVAIEAQDPSTFRTNYFRGGDHPGKYVDVPNFGRVVIGSVYPGIDLAYHTDGRTLEFDYVVAAGGDPSRIVIGIDGATAVHLGTSGDLSIESDGETIIQRRPRAYQVKSGRQVEVRCEYRMTASNEVALDLGQFDRTSTLVIDPVVDYGSFLGGSGDDEPAAVAIGADGYLYVTGSTASSNFPVVAALDSTFGSPFDAYVTKINPATGKMVYSTYLGGANDDYANAIAVDAAGSVYVTGHAGGRFPTTSGAYETATITQAGFVAKLSPAGNTLVYSTYVYGTTPRAIAVDSQGRAAITGEAGTAFVATAGTLRSTYGGSTLFDQTIAGDAFALLLNATGTAAVYATFLGGAFTDAGSGVAFDSAGRVVVGGNSGSSDFPLVGAINTTGSGFVAALAADGKSLVYSTRLDIEPSSMAMDPYGNIVMAMTTRSRSTQTVNALMSGSSLTVVDGTQKILIGKLSTFPLSMRFLTYIGSTANCCEAVSAISTDAVGDIYLFGVALSFYTSYFASIHPLTTDPYIQSKGQVTWFHFASGYSRDGQAIRFQTLLGGGIGGGGIATRGVGQAFVAGTTADKWMPISAYATQAAAAVKSPGTGGDEMFLMTLGMESPALELRSSNPDPRAASPLTLVATSYVPGTSGVVTFFDGGTPIGTASMVEGIAKLDVTFDAGVRRLTASVGTTQAALVLLPVVLPIAQ